MTKALTILPTYEVQSCFPSFSHRYKNAVFTQNVYTDIKKWKFIFLKVHKRSFSLWSWFLETILQALQNLKDVHSAAERCNNHHNLILNEVSLPCSFLHISDTSASVKAKTVECPWNQNKHHMRELNSGHISNRVEITQRKLIPYLHVLYSKHLATYPSVLIIIVYTFLSHYLIN